MSSRKKLSNGSTLCVRIDAFEEENLKKMCEMDGSSKSELVRKALNYYFYSFFKKRRINNGDNVYRKRFESEDQG